MEKEMNLIIKLYSLLGILVSVWVWTLVQSFYALFEYPKLSFVSSVMTLLLINFINNFEKTTSITTRYKGKYYAICIILVIVTYLFLTLNF